MFHLVEIMSKRGLVPTRFIIQTSSGGLSAQFYLNEKQSLHKVAHTWVSASRRPQALQAHSAYYHSTSLYEPTPDFQMEGHRTPSSPLCGLASPLRFLGLPGPCNCPDFPSPMGKKSPSMLSLVSPILVRAHHYCIFTQRLFKWQKLL